MLRRTESGTTTAKVMIGNNMRAILSTIGCRLNLELLACPIIEVDNTDNGFRKRC